MAKVFKLHNTGSNAISGWGNSTQYGQQVIDSIQDPNINNVKAPITSIPSPFARIDLVRTAFEFVSKKDQEGQYPNIDGNSIYNKMVSDSLDVGQIFFEYNKHQNNVDIITWDKQADLQALLNSQNVGQQELGKTYDLFLKQDAQTYNFDQLKCIYLLNYKSQGLQILGATSPRTLFFSTPNDLSNTNIYFGNDKAFDDKYMPLHKRNIEYHKCLQLLRISTPDFATLFPEMDNYLDACYSLSDQGRKNELNKLAQGDYSAYQAIAIGGNSGNNVEVLGINLHQSMPQGVIGSDFSIKSSIAADNPKPLVLPVDTFTQPWVYTADNWDSHTKTPYMDARPLAQRTLPQVGDQYPYLTISDFLEDTIIKMPYEFNEEFYFGGQTESDKDNCYLLPLKPLFFTYFSVDELVTNKMLRLINNSGGVRAELSIPTQKGVIQYTRTYFEDSTASIDATHNDGAVVECNFAFASLSNIRFQDPMMASYRFILQSGASDLVQYKVNAFKKNEMLKPKGCVVRNDNYKYYTKCQTFVFEGDNVDYVQIEVKGQKGVIIPKFVKQNGNDEYVFAVDFGTTNTHVAYSVNGNPAKSFDINANDIQMRYYAKYATDFSYPFEADFVPNTVGDSDFHFPMRTTLSVGKNTNWKNGVWPLGHVNIPFTYERRQSYVYNEILTNLKWSNDSDNVLKIKAYIESLLLILRNKVILNKGDLSKTKLVWFYPVSMTQSRYSNFRDAWKETYEKYFGNSNILSMTESSAPYEFYKGQFGNASIVLVDIGGGTSDTVIANNGEIEYITSFRFAANSIFGSGYSNVQVAPLNGIVKQFKDDILSVIKNSQETAVMGLSNVFDDLVKTNNSADMASFLFSLCDNSKIQEAGVQDQVNFNKKLALDDKQKIVFLLFYTAIIYHVAHIMKAKHSGMPRKLAFSGNGSKVIKVVTTDNTLLREYSKLIFEKVFDSSYPSDGLDIVTDENPKKATCCGGILSPQNQDYMSIAGKKVVLKSSDNSTFVNGETYESICNNDSYIAQTTKQVKNFMDFFFALDKQKNITFTGNFGVSQNSIDIAKQICYQDLENFIKDGLEQKLQEVSPQDVIEESLFFYPLVGILNALSAAIYDSNNPKN